MVQCREYSVPAKFVVFFENDHDGISNRLSFLESRQPAFDLPVLPTGIYCHPAMCGSALLQDGIKFLANDVAG
jgi:hypothetical protein